MDTTVTTNRSKTLTELRFGKWRQITCNRTDDFSGIRQGRCAVGVMAESVGLDPYTSVYVLGDIFGMTPEDIWQVEVLNDSGSSFTIIADHLENRWKETDTGVVL